MTTKTDLTAATAEFLDDTKRVKAKNTFYAYARTLRAFATVCTRKYMEEIDRRDVLNYLEHLKASGNVPRAASNYSNLLNTFFLNQEVTWPLKKTDRVKYTEKVVSAYDAEEITRLLSGQFKRNQNLSSFFS